MTTRRDFLRLTGLFVSSLAFAACGGDGAAAQASARGSATAAEGRRGTAQAKVTLGYFPNITHAPALIGVARDTFKQAVPGVRFDYKTFNAGPALIEAMFAGAVDAGYVGPSPAINGYTQSQGQAVRIIAGAMSGGASFIVRPAAAIKAPGDLAGKKIATPQLGNTQDVALRFYLQQHGLKTRDKGGSVDVVPAQNPDIINLFRQNQIDGAWVPEPWASTLVLQAGGEVFVDERTLWPRGRFAATCVVASPKLLGSRPDIVHGLLRGHLDALALLNRDQTQAKALCGEQIARITSQVLPADVLDRSFTMQDATYDPLAATVLAGADHAFALGFLGGTKPDLSGLIDVRPLNGLLASAGLAPVAAS